MAPEAPIPAFLSMKQVGLVWQYSEGGLSRLLDQLPPRQAWNQRVGKGMDERLIMLPEQVCPLPKPGDAVTGKDRDEAWIRVGRGSTLQIVVRPQTQTYYLYLHGIALMRLSPNQILIPDQPVRVSPLLNLPDRHELL